MKKPSEDMQYFEKMMSSPRPFSDTSCLGHVNHSLSTEEGGSSKSGGKKNAKTKGKPTCHHCGKLGHTTKIY